VAIRALVGFALTLLPAPPGSIPWAFVYLGVQGGTGKGRGSLNLSGKLPPPDRRSGTLAVGMWG
jgi:hypothetical protein